MQTSEIIEGLYKSKELDDCIRKMVREDLREDFKQELFVILCGYDQPTLIKAHDEKTINYLVVRIIINLANQERNVFHKKYLKQVYEITEDVKDDHDQELIDEKEFSHEKIMKLIDGMDHHFGTFYYRALTELLKKHGSMSEASRKTGIPISTISRGIKNVRNYLMTKV